MKNKQIAIALSVFLITSLFIIPTTHAALTDNFVPYVPTNVTAAGLATSGLIIQSYNGQDLYLGQTSNTANVYACYAFNSTNGNPHLLIISDTSSGFNLKTTQYGNNYISTSGFGGISYNDSSYYYNFISSISLSNTLYTTTLPIYESLDDAMANISGTTTDSYSLNYSLPAGNAIVIELGQGSNPYQISTTAINPGPADGTGLGGKQWGFFNTLPSTIEYPLTGAYSIAFRGYGGQSVLGQYLTYSISGDFVLENHTEKYLIIVNPLWAYTSDGDITNSRIDISIDKVNSFRVYPLGTQLVNGGWTSQNEGEYLDGNYDENTDTWYTTDENGNVVESQVGGYNYVDYGPQNIMQWLENIAHQISGFFTGAIGAVNTLVGAISRFSGTLMSLYIWLPPAVQGIITSAIILAITIGVIKVFI